jgi:dTMP kinase
VRRKGRGRFVVIEGLDGAGTTTQADRLGAWLRGQQRRVHVTAEPSRGPVGALIRQVLSGRLGGGEGRAFDPHALALLFAADRLDHVAGEVQPKLAQGVDVVSDRYTLSSLAYQSVATGDARWVQQINSRAARPDVTIFLRVKPSTALRRRRAASLDLELYEVAAFQRALLSAYDEAVSRTRRTGERVEIVDGERSPDEVAADVARVMQRLL